MPNTVIATQSPTKDDFAEHQRTDHRFVMGVTIFAGHVLAILLILG
jgi:hypothetical protein